MAVSPTKPCCHTFLLFFFFYKIPKCLPFFIFFTHLILLNGSFWHTLLCDKIHLFGKMKFNYIKLYKFMPFFFAHGTGKIWRNKTQWLNSGVHEHTFLNRRGTDCFIPLQLRGSRGRRVFLHFLCLLSWSLPPSFFLHNFLEALYTHILYRCRILKKNLTKKEESLQDNWPIRCKSNSCFFAAKCRV